MRKLRYSAVLKAVAVIVAAAAFTAAFFGGVLAVICWQNNVYLDGGGEFMQNSLEGVVGSMTKIRAELSLGDGRPPEFIGSLPFDSETEDGLLLTLRDRDGGVVYSTGPSLAEYAFGYSAVYSEEVKIKTHYPDRREEYLQSGFASASEATAEMNRLMEENGFEGIVKLTLLSASGKTGEAALGWSGSSDGGYGSYLLAPEGEYEAAEASDEPALMEIQTATTVTVGCGVYLNQEYTVVPPEVARILMGKAAVSFYNPNTGKNDTGYVVFNPNTGDYFVSASSGEASLLQDLIERTNFYLSQRSQFLNAVHSGEIWEITDISVSGEISPSADETYTATVYLNDGVGTTPAYMSDGTVRTNMTVSAVRTISRLSLLWPIVAGGSMLVFLISAIYLCCAGGNIRGAEGYKLSKLDYIPLEAYIIALCQVGFLLVECYIMFNYREALVKFYTQRLFTLAASAGIVFGSGLLLSMFILSLASRIKSRGLMKTSIIGGLIFAIIKLISLSKFIFGRIRFTWKAILFGAFVVLLDAGTVLVVLLSENLVIGIIIYAITHAFIIAAFAVWAAGFSNIREYIKKLKKGELNETVDRKFMNSELSQTASDLEGVSEGVKLAVDERMRSERLKTELITNVSHDLKTPLTSIVNYVDILSKDDIEDEAAKEHIGILKRQAARMKKLIEDLVEVSKATSKNISFSLERTDVNLLITQSAAEYEEKFEAAGLTQIINIPEEKITANLDGRLMWRVLDNLLGNIQKYALTGTRVYITVEDRGDDAVISFKNISRCPIDVSAEDLTERFVRGDSSRNTEGSGLGLSIAKSLCELMDVGFRITVDGDLFKAELTVKKCGDGELLEDASDSEERGAENG